MCYKHQQLLMAAFEQFCLLLESGLPMRNALQVTTAQTTDKLVRQVLIRFSQTVNQGLPLYRAAPELPAYQSGRALSACHSGPVDCY